MKQLKKLKLNAAHELNNHEMKLIQGGANQKEYCCSLICIALYNDLDNGAWAGWHYGWDNHCSDFNGNCSC